MERAGSASSLLVYFRKRIGVKRNDLFQFARSPRRGCHVQECIPDSLKSVTLQQPEPWTQPRPLKPLSYSIPNPRTPNPINFNTLFIPEALPLPTEPQTFMGLTGMSTSKPGTGTFMSVLIRGFRFRVYRVLGFRGLGVKGLGFRGLGVRV